MISPTVFLHNFTLGKKAFTVRFAPDPDDIVWSRMTMRTQQTIKKLLSDFFFAVALIFALNSDHIVSFIEDKLTPGSEPGALTNLLDSNQVIRVSFNVAVAELWTNLITTVWNFGYWTCEILYPKSS